MLCGALLLRGGVTAHVGTAWPRDALPAMPTSLVVMPSRARHSMANARESRKSESVQRSLAAAVASWATSNANSSLAAAAAAQALRKTAACSQSDAPSAATRRGLIASAEAAAASSAGCMCRARSATSASTAEAVANVSRPAGVPSSHPARAALRSSACLPSALSRLDTPLVLCCPSSDCTARSAPTRAPSAMGTNKHGAAAGHAAAAPGHGSRIRRTTQARSMIPATEAALPKGTLVSSAA